MSKISIIHTTQIYILVVHNHQQKQTESKLSRVWSGVVANVTEAEGH